MKLAVEYGVELQEQHFGRLAFPIQGFQLWHSFLEDNALTARKSILQFIGHPNAKDNHWYTLACLERTLNMFASSFDSQTKTKLFLYADG